MSPDPHSSAPAQLEFIEHRHKLLRGLRWWVTQTGDPRVPVGAGLTAHGLCRWLAPRVKRMSEEKQDEFWRNLSDWADVARDLSGPADRAVSVPESGWDQTVPVHVAAQILGVSVRTVQRRAPREAGTVRLGDVARPAMVRCGMSDLFTGECEHCRSHQPLA